jgi:hypothetical protein
MQHFLDPARVAATLPRIGTSIDTYCSLQRELHTRDVSADPDYQRRFTGYYRVRRNRAWRQAYFTLLQTHKVHGLPFEAALSAIAQATGRVEASFASKLVATI